MKRKYTTGMESQGYFPTEFSIFIDALNDFEIGESDAIFLKKELDQYSWFSFLSLFL